ncbi:MAG: Periplasmic protein involved in polysaccharide export [Chthonomonadaceae bacterium]|nr:Periplasmic protein involved in polysaccharide export [Chthonomonadaceae bacterium]
MNQRWSLLKQGVAGRAALCGLGTGLVLFAVGSLAQTPIPSPVQPPMQMPGQTPGQTPQELPKTPQTPANPPRVSPGNPLVLSDATRSAPLPTQDVPKKEFRDYTTNADTRPTNVGKPKSLPLFGYDFFGPVRDIIDAHRTYVRRVQRERVDGTGTRQTNGNTSPNGSGNDNTGRRTNGNSNNANDNSNDYPNGGSGSRTTDNSNSNSGSGSNGNQSNSRINDPLNINRNYTDTTGTRNTRGSSIDNTDVNGPDTRMDVSDPLTQLINNVATTVPANYQLAPGDTVVFSYWSPTIERSTLARTVDPQGQITIEGLAPIVLLGKTVASAENTLKEQLGRFYKNVQVSLTLNKLRTIQVTVSGAAYQPGTYTVPSVASMYNLLYFAGGPTENGSLRNIQLLRNGKIVGTLDMYKFELGMGGTDFPLQAGDMLIIPPRESRVTVSGEVKHPAIFELSPSETLEDALRYAGGIYASGVNRSVRINTLDPGNARIIQDVNVTDAAAVKAQKLYDGDEVEVFSVRPLVFNTVTVEGAVDQPNSYPLTPNMRVSDLVNRARGPLNEAYLQRAELRRWNPDTTTTLVAVDLDRALAHDPQNDLVLQNWDRLKIYTRDEVAYLGRRFVTVKGAVQKEGIYPVSRNEHVSDLLREAGGPTPDANLEKAFLIHQPDTDAPISVPVNLRAVLHGDPGSDPEILDNDQLLIYNVRQTQFTPDHIVQVVGAVLTQGPYPRAQNMKVSDLIAFAGGFLPAAGQKVSVAHAIHLADDPSAKSVKLITLEPGHVIPPQDDVVLQDGDVVSVQGIGGFIPAVQKVFIRGAVNAPGYIIITNKTTHLTEALRQAGGLRPEAFPQGTEFYRNPDLLGSTTQKQLTMSIGLLNDLLNGSEYQRQRAKSRLDIIKATGQAQSGSIVVPSATASAALPNAAADAAGNQLANQELVSRARSNITDIPVPDGNIAVNVPRALKNPGTGDDIVLQDGDTITIPETPTTVQVLGAVFHTRGVQYRPGETLQQYVDEAGGFAPDAAKDRIEVIRVGGGLIPARKAGQIQPGDVILVPTKVLAIKISNNSDYISQFFSSLTSSVLVYKLATSLFGL